jgi:nucleoside-diphosphate-sugar epimerase
MTAFVLGATGFVGREVVRQLGARGASPVAHVRPDSRALADWQARFAALGATVDTTPWDPAALAARLRAVDPAQIYILIGTTRGRARSDAIAGNIYEAVDLGLTEKAVAAAVASERRPRLVYLSSVGADPKARSAYLAARGDHHRRSRRVAHRRAHRRGGRRWPARGRRRVWRPPAARSLQVDDARGARRRADPARRGARARSRRRRRRPALTVSSR